MTDTLERWQAGRDMMAEAFESICPYVLGNPLIPKDWKPFAKQALYLGMHLNSNPDEVHECLYGGSAGGGKSEVLLAAASQYAWQFPEYAGAIIRRSLTDLEQPGALLDRAHSWWRPAGASYNGSSRIFTFPSGSKIKMGYCRNKGDEMQFQGSEYHFTGWDELSQQPTDYFYKYIGFSRVRRKKNQRDTIPLRTLSTSNPGGPGHAWVKRRFLGGVDEEGIYRPPVRPYLPAGVRDNPHLDVDAYVKTLQHLPPILIAQLLNGDWDARDPGDYFRLAWFGPLLDPEVDTWPASQCTRIRWWDLAASTDESACRTAGVRMARHHRGSYAVEHCSSFRAAPGDRDARIIQTAQADGYGVAVGLEIEPGSGGPAQFYHLEKQLKAQGFRVIGARPKSEMNRLDQRVVVRSPGNLAGKAARADPVASCLARGAQMRGEVEDLGYGIWGSEAGLHPSLATDGIRLFSGNWTSQFVDAIEPFPTEDVHCDEVDAMSGAYAWLSEHSAAILPPEYGEPVPCYDENSHPEVMDQVEKVNGYQSPTQDPRWDKKI